MGVWWLVVVVVVVVLGAPPFCSSSGDCSESGVCMRYSNGTSGCHCDWGFHGPRCASLHLTGEAYRSIANLPGLHLNGSLINSVWGGRGVASPEGYSWVGSAFTHGGGTAKWTIDSVIVQSRAQDGGVLGPFNLSNIVLQGDNGTEWDSGSIDEGYIIENPHTWSNGTDRWLLYYTGFARTSDPLSTRQIGVAYSPTLSGPWRQWRTPVLSPNTNASAVDISTVSTAAPGFTTEGTVLLAYKGLGLAHPSKPVCTDGSGRPCVFIASAPHWSGPYTHVTANNNEVIEGEDPTLWRDSRGGWHMLVEKYVGDGEKGVGAHWYSRTGVSNWRVTPTDTWYTTNVVLEGKRVKLTRRERPQLVFDPEKPYRPVALFNGASIGEDEFNIGMMVLK